MARELEIVYGATLVDSVAAGTGVYTLEANQPTGWIRAGLQIKIHGCTNSANNGVFTVTTLSGTTLTTSNTSSVSEASSPGKVGWVVGATSNRELTGVIMNTKKFETFTMEAVFSVGNPTQATYESEIVAAEAAFSTPFQDLIITQGTTERHGFRQSANTGLDAMPEILKREDNASGRSRRYTIRVVVGLPANTGAELVTGLREHTVEVKYDPNRVRTVTITGVFTANSSNNARAQYEAQIGSLENSVFTALSITAANRELAEEPQADHSYNTKTVNFRRMWRELIFSQGGSSNDDSAIKRQILRIGREKVAPGDTPGVKRLATLTVHYECWLDKDVTTNIMEKYDAIRGWIIDQVKTTLGGGVIAVTKDKPEPNYDENRLTVTMEVMGTTGGTILERSISVEDEHDFGTVLIAAWTGDPLSKYDYQGPAVKRRTVTDTKTVLGFVYDKTARMTDAGASIFTGASLNIVKTPDGKAVHLSTKPKYTHRKMGLHGNQFDVTDIVKVDLFEFFKEIKHKSTNNVATGAGGS